MRLILPRTFKARFKTHWEGSKWALGIALFCGCALALRASPLEDFIQKSTLRGFYALRGDRPPSSDVVLIGISSQDLLHLHAQHWLSQSTIAAALKKIEESEPRAVFVDFTIDHTENDAASDNQIISALRHGRFALVSEKVYRSADESEAVPVGSFDSSPDFLTAAESQYEAVLQPGSKEISEITFESELTSAPGTVSLFPALKEVKFDIEEPDRFGLINFYGPPGTIRHLSLTELLNSESEQISGSLRGRIVFVGFQSLPGYSGGTKGTYQIAHSARWMSDTEIRANVAANLLDASWLRRLAPDTETSLFVVCLLMLLLIEELFAPVERPFVLGLLLMVQSYAAYLAFTQHNWWFASFGTLCLITLARVVAWLFYPQRDCKLDDPFDFGKFDFEDK